MKTSTKAALLSCLVFPGAGHWYLKRFVLGLMLSFGAAVAVYFIASSALSAAFELAEKIRGGDVLLNLQAITELVSQQTSTSEESTSKALITLVIFWLIGIFDSYRLGRAVDTGLEVVGETKT